MEKTIISGLIPHFTTGTHTTTDRLSKSWLYAAGVLILFAGGAATQTVTVKADTATVVAPAISTTVSSASASVAANSAASATSSASALLTTSSTAMSSSAPNSVALSTSSSAVAMSSAVSSASSSAASSSSSAPLPPNTISLAGINYKVTVTAPTSDGPANDGVGTNGPFWGNTITNTSTGQSYTYSFSNGEGASSHLYAYDTSTNALLGSVNFGVVTTTTDSSNRIIYSHTGDIEAANGDGTATPNETVSAISVTETLVVYADGRIVHEFTATNTGSSAAPSLYFVAGLDTDLNGNDDIPIYADGNGGSYIQDNGMTLWNQPVSNVTEYAGDWPDGVNNGNFNWSNYHAVSGLVNGTTVVTNEDTAIAYRTPTITLQAGQNYQFSLQERLYTDSSSPFDQNNNNQNNIQNGVQNNTPNGTSGNSRHSVTARQIAPSSTNKTVLPNTGDSDSLALVYEGAALFAMAGMVYGLNKRKVGKYKVVYKRAQ